MVKQPVAAFVGKPMPDAESTIAAATRSSPGRWIALGFGAILVAAVLVAGIRIAGDLAVVAAIERAGGSIGFRRGGPSWLRRRFPDNRYLPWFDSLAGVELNDSPLSQSRLEALIARLERFPTLRGISLDGTSATDETLLLLDRFPRLDSLSLSRTRISDAGVSRIVVLGEIRHLDLSGTAVTDTGVRRLAELPSLRILHLDNTAVTDDGIRALAELAHLRELSVSNTNVTESALETLFGNRSAFRISDD